MKNNIHKLPKKEVRSLYTFKGVKLFGDYTTSTAGDTTGTCSTVTSTTHFNK